MQDTNVLIAKLRSESQQIAKPQYSTAKDVISWFGAMQAQDYAAAKWAIGGRVNSVTDSNIEQLIEAKELVRTWPMRGTIHFVRPEDAHWMLGLMAGRVERKFKTMHAKLGLTAEHFAKASVVLQNEMPGKRLTRKQLHDILHEAGMDVEGQRLYHTLVYLAHHGQLAITGLEGKQPTFVWFDDWFPEDKRRNLDRKAALRQMAQYYIQSHGPVTVYDFAWWTGLTVSDAREAFALLGPKIVSLPESPAHWLVAQSLKRAQDVPGSVFLAPAFDETIVALKDRSAVVSPADFSKLTPYTNGIFSPSILIDGQFAGTWRRIQKAKGIVVECQFSRRLEKEQVRQLDAEADRYARFLGQALLSFEQQSA